MTTAKKTITIEIVVDAPVDKVWTCWTGPVHITQWNQASEDWHTSYAENDIRIGGKFKSTMAAKDGSMSFDFEGVYTQVKEHELLEYMLPDGREVKVVFQPEGDKVKVIETFDPENTNPEEMQRAGWQAILESFRTYTETV